MIWRPDLTEEEFLTYLAGFVRQTLRRASYRWPYRNQAQKAARIRWGYYECNSCKKETPAKEKKLDHIEPVVDPLVGFTTWDSFILRLFVGQRGWQVLCLRCHEDKTREENSVRRSNRAAKTAKKRAKK